ncbi:hypothetical protein PISMIDRAFT_19607 [Pisolithus microcarpus 441]|uniref:Uncharacterized protein n=1 Tax=Pisolithus microcarpus 441 TaxID=765257 RepID=A0A0C9YBI1_9AGAM|nr:hypothetical protein BKA83DRAFT_19607 [Pisolithus microcarpus]KIK11334.1 hypothetical protein PISMIDRAFT_19607 [Pisolithus microcarpus 441]
MSRNSDTATTPPSIPMPSISTGKQTADGIPNEALVDLLTSDGIDDPPPTSTIPQVRVMADGATLRDESRRFDFEKICSVFEGQNRTESPGGILAGPSELDQWVLDSLGGGTQTDMVEDLNTFKANPVSATEQDSRPDRSGYHDIEGAVPLNDAPPPCDDLTTPFSFDQLNDTLGSASDEMHTLHQQYGQLQKLVAGRLGKGNELKGSERKMPQKVASKAQDSKTYGDATALSDLRAPDTTVRDVTDTGPQIAIGGGSGHGPKKVGDQRSLDSLRSKMSIDGTSFSPCHRKYDERPAF